MSAYVVVDITVTDPQEYQTYIQLAPAAVEAFGGKYLARGGKVEVLEGDWQPNRLVILEFPSMERAKEWLHSDLYQPARHIRHKTAQTNMIVVEAVS
ncbi:MAG: DUF1330 domain-containing protein [Anaerolineales bacterium]|nr:DUF1330 domain-containing protein [Anaerolineales bacterium]